MAHTASTILVVAADPALLALARGIELGADLVIHTCSGPNEADRLAGRLEVDVVLADAELGQSTLSGQAWLAHLKRRDPDCFRILSLAPTAFPAAIEAINQGAIDACLPRPWHQPQLLQLLHQGCEAALIRRHNRSLVLELGERNTQLLEMTANLEGLVDERTRHLREANERLREAHAQLQANQAALVHLETQGAVTQLVRGLAHELNNPLAAILGYAQRLRRSWAKDDAEAARRLDVITGEVERCVSLVEQMRNLAQPLDEDPVPCLIGEALDRASARLSGLGIVPPRIQLRGPQLEILAAPRSLVRVCEIILDNAQSFGARDVICTCARETGGGRHAEPRVRITIANDGQTPSAEAQAHATRPFFTTRAAAGHRGLGLALAFALLRDQEGTISLTAREGAPGAAVLITLPAPQNAIAEVPARTPSGIGHGWAIVAEDEPLVAELLADALGDLGYAVRIVTTVRETLTAAAELSPRLCLIDRHLADGSGADALRRLRAAHPALAGHLALTTGDGDPATLSAELDAPVLAKPFRIEDVERLILTLG